MMHTVVKLLTFGKWPPGGRRARADRPAGRRRVWRISEGMPEGEWIDPDSTPPSAREARTSLPMDSWATSSMDLRDGMQVLELDDEATNPH